MNQNDYGNACGTFPSQKRKTGLLIALLSLAVAVVIAAFLVGITLVAKGFLDRAKDTEAYPVAYAYLIESDAFRSLGTAEERITLNSYSYSLRTVVHQTSVSSATFGFRVGGSSYTVVCHSENGEWQVCTACTSFS